MTAPPHAPRRSRRGAGDGRFRGRRTGRDRAGGTVVRTAGAHDAIAGVGCAPTGAHDLVVKIDRAIRLAFAGDGATFGGDRLLQPGEAARVRAAELARAADVDTRPCRGYPRAAAKAASAASSASALRSPTNHGSVGARSETG
jgi:hypothetical protein